MRKRNFTITDSMLAAGARAMWNCREEGGHSAQSVCRIIFETMLEAASTHPGIPARKFPGRGELLSARRREMPRINGCYLPMTIWHPDDFPLDKFARCDYWYLSPRYEAALRKVLADPEQCAKLKFHKP